MTTEETGIEVARIEGKVAMIDHFLAYFCNSELRPSTVRYMKEMRFTFMQKIYELKGI